MRITFNQKHCKWPRCQTINLKEKKKEEKESNERKNSTSHIEALILYVQLESSSVSRLFVSYAIKLITKHIFLALLFPPFTAGSSFFSVAFSSRFFFINFNLLFVMDSDKNHRKRNNVIYPFSVQDRMMYSNGNKHEKLCSKCIRAEMQKKLKTAEVKRAFYPKLVIIFFHLFRSIVIVCLHRTVHKYIHRVWCTRVDCLDFVSRTLQLLLKWNFSNKSQDVRSSSLSKRSRQINIIFIFVCVFAIESKKYSGKTWNALFKTNEAKCLLHFSEQTSILSRTQNKYSFWLKRK